MRQETAAAISPLVRVEALRVKAKAAGKVAPPKSGDPVIDTPRADIVQLPLWPEIVRCLPNEILRSALFNAKNRKQPREGLKKAAVSVIGDGKITYTGEELRQDDETVWLQLLHMAKAFPAGHLIEFTPYAFCKAIGWSISGQSYERLRDCLTRMQATGLAVYSKRLTKGVSLSMIPYFEWQDEATGESLPRWGVRIAAELVLLFGDVHFTRMEWEQRLALPDGLATWLHGYFASHRTPGPIKLDTIRRGAGLTTDSKAELRRLIAKALDALVRVKFLQRYSIEGDVISVTRTERE